jgi:hypothetical protein
LVTEMLQKSPHDGIDIDENARRHDSYGMCVLCPIEFGPASQGILRS